MEKALFGIITREAADYKFEFFEDPSAYAEELAKGNLIYAMVFCKIYRADGRIAALYCRKWEKKAGKAAIQNFINKFMTDAEYREQYWISGEHIRAVYDASSLVHPDCLLKIRYLNRNEGMLNFSDYAELKTYGNDGVSLIKADTLKQYYPKELQDYLVNLLENEEDVIKVLRWLRRGLSLNNAVKKVKVDMAIKERR